MATSTNRQVFQLVPAGILDRCDPRVTQYADQLVQVIQPAGCPKNGTFGMTYVQVADSGEFVGLVSKNSLVKTGKTAPVRDRAAEARERRTR